MHFVVKFFPEITIKSPPVRKRFVKQLRRNLHRLLKSLVAGIEVKAGWDKFDIVAPSDSKQDTAKVAGVLANTPGIAYFAEVTVFDFDQIEDIGPQVLLIWQESLMGKSFAVRVKRSGEHAFKSIDVERMVGAVLNRGCVSAQVKLKNPDITIRLEIVKQRCFIVLKQQQGLGGYPLGTQEPVLSLVSGGFDSTVASYLTNKRGLTTHFCFFNLGGRAHELGVKEVSYYLWQKFAASHNVRFISVPFEGVVSEILENVHNSQMGVVLKRMMLRVATKVARDLKIGALVTGESVAQVSSQTLTNLRVINSVTELLVLRPLITMDKGEIINLSRAIGTEEYAANMPEYCGVISVKPTTRATIERIEAEEANFNWQIFDAAYEARRDMAISEVANDLGGELESLSVTKKLEESDVVVDIRHPNEAEIEPLTVSAATLKIPFYKLNTQFQTLDQDKFYLLYCDKGVMSQLHAAHLRDEGFENVGVYQAED